MKHRNTAYLFFCLAFAFSACKKETQYVYEINEVQVSKTKGEKVNVKSTVEFISIAYSDVFGSTIAGQDLVKLQTAYIAFGDMKFIEDLIIRNFLNETTNAIPSNEDMRADIDGFIKKTYLQLFSRTPDEYEVWFLKKQIEADASVTPEIIYYSLMTSNEYRYY